MKDDVIVEVGIDVFSNLEDECVCNASERIKPLWIDDLLWDLLDMQSNKNERLSLRVNGAFTVVGVRLYRETQRIITWTQDELETVVEQYVAHFAETVEKVTINDFIDNIEEPTYHGNLRRTLHAIHEERYSDALAIVSNKERGGFQNGNIEINDAIRQYCQARL